MRSACARANRIYEARAIAGHNEEESVEAEAGALLDADTSARIHGIYAMIESWIEAHNTGG